MMEFGVKSFKGFVSEAATAFSRAVQYTEEKLGTSEKTELDAHFESLAQRADKTKLWTERIVSRTDAVLQPNPNAKVEDYLFEKLERKRDRHTNFEALGQDMIDAGLDFGPGTAYGSTLIKVGQAQQKLGKAEKEFVRSAGTSFIQPLRKFLEGDMKTLQKERRILESKRLDLDACKNRLRKAKSMEAQANTKPDLIQREIQQAEQELRLAQSEYDRQAEITKLLLEGVSSAHANHLRCLNDFVEAQMSYFTQCQQYEADLQREMSSGTTDSFQNIYPSFSANAGPTSTAPDDKRKQARVLYDYDAHDKSELSLLADEVIHVTLEPGQDPDWMIGERGKQKGKVPTAYLEMLN
ncbi:endophilin-B2-like isoform X2 [Limulus polyphemus]|uniref:Endophilin-B2-like isoform X2 n=1 Tax=Limulus polyphemus TaxID=6850 RepID=A0ABM1BL85_LIMPO|nr:endophilin-B2-like isoform X2 [Limulus polyphemus]